MTGTYVLALWLKGSTTIAVGRHGEFEFPSGWYLYVGSALGPGGLPARLARHRRRLASGKKARWHVDHLRERAVWGGAWVLAAGERPECTWAAALRRLPGAQAVIPGFGASDCRCPGHLLHVPDLPGDGWFRDVLGAEKMVLGQDEIEELLEVLVSGDEESREAAALALGRFGTIATRRLATLLIEGDQDARWWAARALAEVGKDGTVPPLVGALDDPDPDVRACAALALGHIGDSSAAEALAARLADESAFVASIVADALSMIGEQAVGVLAERLADNSSYVRLLAVRALGRIRSQSCVVPLFGLLEDPSYLVRHYAQEALEALGVGMIYFAP
jgi:HEAT repeat protein/Uri superfamily endonuclease